MAAARTMAVVGAGVAGLAVAIAARRRGFEVSVYDGRDSLPERGGVLLLWANGVKAVRALDPELETSLIASGTIVRKTEFRTWRSQLLWSLPMARFRREYGADAVLIARSALCAILAREAESLGATIRWGVACDGYSLVGARVRPRLAISPALGAGSLADGLIGCDGIHSRVRTRMCGGSAPPRSAYHVAWIGISEVSESVWPYGTGHIVTFLGGGPRFCAYTLATRSSRRTIYWYATELESSVDKQRYVSKRRLLALFRERMPAAADVIAASVGGYPEKFAIKDNVPSRQWSEGPVVILGDAAHASTPDLGQGTCQALESAVVLGEELAHCSDVARAFARFARRRMNRTARVTALSRVTAMLSMIHAPGLDALRDSAIRTLLPPITLTELDRLFRGEIGTMR